MRSRRPRLRCVRSGEPQYPRQLNGTRTAPAQELGTTGPVLKPDLPRLRFRLQSVSDPETQIRCANASRVASGRMVAIWYKNVFASFENRTALMVGAGETIALAAASPARGRPAAHDRREPQHRPAPASSPSEFQGFAISLDDIPRNLREADIRRPASTASPNAIITRAMAADALRARKRSPDLSWSTSPCRLDIEPEVAQL